MRIQDMFVQNIDRSINGVVKVAQNDTQSLEQELREYIITKELRKHFYTFFENYSKAILTPTDQIGVWISGFFGSVPSSQSHRPHIRRRSGGYRKRIPALWNVQNLLRPAVRLCLFVLLSCLERACRLSCDGCACLNCQSQRKR